MPRIDGRMPSMYYILYVCLSVCLYNICSLVWTQSLAADTAERSRVYLFENADITAEA